MKRFGAGGKNLDGMSLKVCIWTY